MEILCVDAAFFPFCEGYPKTGCTIYIFVSSQKRCKMKSTSVSLMQFATQPENFLVLLPL